MATGNTAARPFLACEISADRVIAARAARMRDLVEAHTSRSLPAGAVTPSLGAANITDAPALTAVIAEALGTLAGRSRDVIAILPDAAVRVALLEFDQLPANQNEAAGVIRFRLKKSLPFDVEKATVSFHAWRHEQPIRVVASVMLTSVLEEYERVFVDAGYSPGVVIPSTLAALGALEAGGPALIVKVSPLATTLTIADRDQLRLFRTLESAAVNSDPERLVEEIHPSLVFYQDHYGAEIERVLIAGGASASSLRPAFGSQIEARIEDLVPERYVGGSLGSGASAGALAGAVGALLG